MNAYKDVSEWSWAGSLKPILLFFGKALKFIFPIFSGCYGMCKTWTLRINFFTLELAETPKKLNFHFQVFWEKYNFPIVTTFQCWLTRALLNS